MGQAKAKNKRLLTEEETRKIWEDLAGNDDPYFPDEFDQNLKISQDAKTLTLVVTDTLKKVGEVLSAIGYYEKSEDFLLEFEDYQKMETQHQKALSSKRG